MMEKCWLHLTNGWTVSISNFETPPAKANVTAWPSRYDNASSSDPNQEIYFTFSDGKKDVRCFNIEDIRKAVSEVENGFPAHKFEAGKKGKEQ